MNKIIKNSRSFKLAIAASFVCVSMVSLKLQAKDAITPTKSSNQMFVQLSTFEGAMRCSLKCLKMAVVGGLIFLVMRWKA